MANNYIINGDQTVSFALTGAAPTINGEAVPLDGTTGATTGVGWAQSASAQNQADKAELRDGNGNVFTTVLYNQNGQVSLSLLLKAGATLPKIGDTLTVGGKSGCIESVSQNWQNQDGTSLEISATWYAGITPVAAP